MEISVEFDPNEEEISAYEYGFMTFSGNKGSVSSKEYKSGQIMVFLSLSWLLSVITPLLHNRKEFIYVFQGIDTPGFQICFQKKMRKKKGIVTVSCLDQIIDISSSEEIYQDICLSVRKICLDALSKMDEKDRPICTDLIESTYDYDVP